MLRLCLLVVLLPWGTISVSAQEPPQEVPILKQINRVNDDGSYTFGYEAADGSFKIETRDVLGNVKGMFGFIDETGELKRVSYTASNGTGFHASGNIGNSPPDKLVQSSGYTTVRSETSDSDTTSRRPILILRHTGNPTRPPVIQHIPRRTLVTTTSEPQTSTTPAYGEYINGRRPQPVKDIFANNNRQEPTAAPVTEISEVTEPPPPQTNAPLKRILVSRRPLDDKTSHAKGGNLLRRQLVSEQNSRSEDAPDVYSGGEPIPRLVPSPALNPPQAHLLATLNPLVAAAYRNQLLAQNGLRPDPLPQYVQPNYLNPDTLYDPRQAYPPVPLAQPIDRNRFLQALPQPYPIPGVISTKARQPAAVVDEQEYPVPNGQPGRKLKTNGRNPSVAVRPIYSTQEDAQPPSVFTSTDYQSLRDELMDYLLQYLQYRSNRINPLLLNTYLPQYPNPSFPGLPYPNQVPLGYPNPYLNPGYINPYANPNLIYSRQPFVNPNYPYPPLIPFGSQNYPPPPQNIPFVNPNIQYSQQYHNGQQPILRGYERLPLSQQTAVQAQNTVRPTQATTESGDYQLPPADLLRMFISRGMTTPSYEPSPSRQSAPESYSTTTSTTPRPVLRQKQPVRNVQILGSESKLSTATVKPPEDEMEMQSR